MKKISTLILFLFLLIWSGHSEAEIVRETLTVFATQDAMLRSGRPDTNFSGKTEAMRGYGYGIKKALQGGKITYPILIMEENETILTPHNAFVLGGFDFTPLLSRFDPVPKPLRYSVTSAKLRLFVHYAARDITNVKVQVFRILARWDETKVTYSDFYKFLPPDEYGAHVTRNAHFKDVIDLIATETINLKSNKDKITSSLPFDQAPGFIEFDITKGFDVDTVEEGNLGSGIFVCFNYLNSPDYNMKDSAGNKVSTGDVEIACTEWLAWDGKVPAGFAGNWKNITNNARGKKEYVPQILFEIEGRPNPVYTDFLNAQQQEDEMSDEEAADMLQEMQMYGP